MKKRYDDDDQTGSAASGALRDLKTQQEAGFVSPPLPADDETIPLRTAEELLRHPLFPKVRAELNRGTVDLYTTQRFPGGFAVDAWRVILLGQIVGLAGADIEGGTTATPTELKQRMASYGLYSARQIDAYLSRLIQTGHLEVVVPPGDRRMRLLRPLPPLIDWYWCFLELYCIAYQRLFPDRNFDLVLRRDDGFLPFMACLGADRISMTIAMELLMRDPDLAAFFSRGSASLVLHAALIMNDEHPGREMREADFLVLSDRLGRSRSHIRNIIALAIEKGFFEEVRRRPQTLRITPRLVETMRRYLADTIRASELTYRRAERAYHESLISRPAR